MPLFDYFVDDTNSLSALLLVHTNTLSICLALGGYQYMFLGLAVCRERQMLSKKSKMM